MTFQQGAVKFEQENFKRMEMEQHSLACNFFDDYHYDDNTGVSMKQLQQARRDYYWEENDFFDAELAGNFKFECLAEQPTTTSSIVGVGIPIKSNRKTFFDRFGFRNYSEMRNCNEEGMQ